MNIEVISKEGYDFWAQGPGGFVKVNSKKPVFVTYNHNIRMRIKDGYINIPKKKKGDGK